MDTYINKIDSIGHEAIEEEKILRKEIEFLKCKVNALPISKDASIKTKINYGICPEVENRYLAQKLVPISSRHI